jgi:hypothetical protein
LTQPRSGCVTQRVSGRMLTDLCPRGRASDDPRERRRLQSSASDSTEDRLVEVRLARRSKAR